jgi:polyhydroxyalkanoate synthase
MEQNILQFNQNVQNFFNVHENMWEKVQEFYYGKNPLNEALAKVNNDDMAVFFEALAKNPTRLMEMQFKWWQGQMQIYQNVMLRGVMGVRWNPS